MTPEELGKLLQSEDERTEWKQSTKDASDILHAVCALANDLGDSRAPGFLVIGVAKNGNVVGVNLAGSKRDEEQQILASRLHSSKLWPTPASSMSIVEYEGKQVFVVEVAPYPVPPIVEVDRVAWVRHGSTTRRATQADLQRLRERRPLSTQPFDLRPFEGATIEDLDTRALDERYALAREGVDDVDVFPSFESWLTQIQLGSVVRGTWTPNPAALLVFGKSPQSHLPGAIVELVRYAGDDIDAPVSWRRTAAGTLPQQLEVLWAQVSAHVTAVPGRSEGIRSPFVDEYPVEALKELARNLVQHRQYEGTNAPGRIEWYDDRIEFFNPGGPFGRASEGEFGSHSDYRNPIITDWLKQLGYIEQLGRGIRLVGKYLTRNGNPPIEVEVNGFTRVTVRRNA